MIKYVKYLLNSVHTELLRHHAYPFCPLNVTVTVTVTESFGVNGPISLWVFINL